MSLLTQRPRALRRCSPYPVWYLPAAYAVMVATHFHPSLNLHVRHAMSGGIMIALLSFQLTHASDDPACDYAMNTVVLEWLLQHQDFSYLSRLNGTPPRWIGRGTSKDKEGRGLSEYDAMNLWQRLKWATTLYLNPRGIGWDWQVKGVPSNPDASLPRWKYVIKKLLQVVYHQLMNAAAEVALGFSWYLTLNPSAVPSMPQQTWLVTTCWSVAILYCQAFLSTHAIAALITVGTGLSSSWEWPPLMDSLSKAWSLRQVWGVVYHQCMRRIVQFPSQCIAKALGLKKGSLASKYFQLYTCFLFSGLVHLWLSYVATRKSNGEMLFFMLQPMAISVEDFVIWCYGVVVGTGKANRSWRVLGYVWVLAWFSWSLTLWVPALLEQRIQPGSPRDHIAVMRAYKRAEQFYSRQV
ncbi:hypothetical protein EJ03DRAFT_204302 [Teratosphaeria nubilosa]|uniref:Wax synthase domain-containing protein n=1 Tax=Teratosphaeria nubilosa TaxID=161662 RepID=A0A6G1LHS8_9PEZI|nr:hypothetical protein EJ03DRAFT_204302 [Teratosphaeria nubilosa]